VQSVVAELAALERLADIPRLLQLCAARTGTELNVSAVASDLGIPARTMSGYLARLETAFLLRLVPAWSTNLSAKVVRRPKLFISDVGLAAHLQGATTSSLTRAVHDRPDGLDPFFARETLRSYWKSTYLQDQPENMRPLAEITAK